MSESLKLLKEKGCNVSTTNYADLNIEVSSLKDTYAECDKVVAKKSQN
jgi:hypothetical protein